MTALFRIDERRLVRRHVQHIVAPPARVFPLLCPEMECQWLPGWRYRMLWSQSGYAERGAVFATGDAASPTLWVVSEHVPPHHVAFVRWQADGLVVHIDLRLGARDDGGSDVAITYTDTVVAPAGAAAINRLSAADWAEMMAFWQESMNQWLRNHPTPPSPARP